MTEQPNESKCDDVIDEDVQQVVPRVVQLCAEACEKVSGIGPIGVTDDKYRDGWETAVKWCAKAVRMLDPAAATVLSLLNEPPPEPDPGRVRTRAEELERRERGYVQQ